MTEMALTSIANGILMALDQKQAILLVLLDLSVTFHMVDRHVQLKWLEARVGLSDKALDWIKSYLSQCQQHVSVGAEGGRANLPLKNLSW